MKYNINEIPNLEETDRNFTKELREEYASVMVSLIMGQKEYKSIHYRRVLLSLISKMNTLKLEQMLEEIPEKEALLKEMKQLMTNEPKLLHIKPIKADEPLNGKMSMVIKKKMQEKFKSLSKRKTNIEELIPAITQIESTTEEEEEEEKKKKQEEEKKKQEEIAKQKKGNIFSPPPEEEEKEEESEPEEEPEEEEEGEPEEEEESEPEPPKQKPQKASSKTKKISQKKSIPAKKSNIAKKTTQIKKPAFNLSTLDTKAKALTFIRQNKIPIDTTSPKAKRKGLRDFKSHLALYFKREGIPFTYTDGDIDEKFIQALDQLALTLNEKDINSFWEKLKELIEKDETSYSQLEIKNKMLYINKVEDVGNDNHYKMILSFQEKGKHKLINIKVLNEDESKSVDHIFNVLYYTDISLLYSDLLMVMRDAFFEFIESEK